MKSLILLFLSLLFSFSLHAKDTLIFGAITTVDSAIIKKKFTPLLDYLEQKTGKRIVFQTGYNYEDTINKFSDGTFDLGYIGPAPYLFANEKRAAPLKIIAGLESNHTPYFHSVIITKKSNPISDITDLKGKKIAFGSPKSTLSYYVPMQMLMKKGVDKELDRFDFLGKHDKVAQYVIMGKYEAGAVKEAVAKKYAKFLKIIATSESIHDFSIMASDTISEQLFQTLQAALYELKDPDILKGIKPSATGFIPRKASDYDNLKHIMKEVDARSK